MSVTKFPGWRYHEDGRSTCVATPDALIALGKGWHESPGEAADAAEAKAAQKAAAKAAADAAKGDGKGDKGSDKGDGTSGGK